MTRKMKDSGIEWIGEIPEDWDSIVLKYIIINRQAGVWGNDEIPNSPNNRVCIRVADFDFPNMTIRGDRAFTLRNYTEKEIQKYILEKEDILIEKSGGGEKSPVGRTILWDGDFEALYANFIERIRVDKNQILPKFAQYCFYSFYADGCSKLYFNQTTGIQNLDITRLINEVQFPIPCIDTQNLIVNFVDSKCLEIRKIKETINQEIQTLQDYKKSLITEAVTNGLDKDVEMKDSGIEWIGEIPKHWNLVPLKYLSQITMGQSVSGDDILVEENGYDFLQGCAEFGNITPKAKYWSINPNKIARRGSILMSVRAPVGKINKADKNYGIGRGLCALYSNNNDYLYYLLLSSEDRLLLYSNGSTYDAVTVSTISNFKVVIPPNNEQTEIVNYLDSKCKTIDDAINSKKRQLEILEEYRKSLIYEYVTGKKEVLNV